MFPSRSGTLWFFVLCLGIAPIACKPTRSSEQEPTKEILVVPDFQQLAPIHPILTKTTISANLVDIVFDGLVRLDDRFLPVPHIAESWIRSSDGLTWTLHIRPDVRFHDGSELTAEDVVFTFEKMKEIPNATVFGFVFQHIKNVVVQDRYTVIVTLNSAIASFPQALSVGILGKKFWENRVSKLLEPGEFPIGSGPFQVVSWSPQEILLEANNQYFLGRPHIDGIRVVSYPSREAAWAKLVAGEVDFFSFLSGEKFGALQQIPSIRTYSIPNPFYYLIAFNSDDLRFKDRRIRRALNYAVDKDEIVGRVLKGQGRAAAGTIYPGSWAFNPDVRPYPYNPQKALALFREAGWEDHDGDHLLDKNGRPFEFLVHTNAGDDLKEKALLLVQQDLMDLGIVMKVRFFDAADVDFLFNKGFQAHFPEITARYDPDLSYLFFHSSQIRGGYNFFSYANEEVDRLLEEARATFDLEERKELYFAYQEEMLKDPPGIFLFWMNYLVGVHKRFKDVTISPLGPFANIGEWYVSENEP